MVMPEIVRFTGGSDAINLEFVERVHTPRDVMEYAIELHLNGLSLSDTVISLVRFGINRGRSTIHNWVQKSDLEPPEGCNPEKVALDETVVKVEGDRFGSLVRSIPLRTESSILGSIRPEIRQLRGCFSGN